jgi:predicted SAM-dependent methyltransferase
MVVRELLGRSGALRGLREDVRRARTRSARRSELEAADVAHRARVDAYLAEHDVRRLQLGAGRTVLRGWLSTDLHPKRPDILPLDVTRPFPFPDDSFDYVFAEHLIEHVSWRDGQVMLAEVRRVLRPGGVLRVATPDLGVLISLYRGEAGADGDHYVDWVSGRYLPDVGHRHPVFVLNNAMRNWGHTFLYDAETLALALADAGFTGVVRRGLGESEHADLRGVESHGRAVADQRSVRFETMVLEAAVPELAPVSPLRVRRPVVAARSR